MWGIGPVEVKVILGLNAEPLLQNPEKPGENTEKTGIPA
jgi:hypothetical protein